MFTFGYFSTVWKSAQDIPTPKPGQPPSESSSRRPVKSFYYVKETFRAWYTLQSEPLYLLEPHSNPEHFGFREKKKPSTLSALPRIADFVTHGFNFKNHTGVVLLGIENACDSVWISGLLCKLILFLLPNYLLYFL